MTTRTKTKRIASTKTARAGDETALPRADVYERVTTKIIEQLEAGTRPWSKPWTDGTPGSDPALMRQ
ncbi:antirestriction protein ArdC [Devosia sp. UYZn731]|uniref:ArdC family protein n=1 Tax=Devosia sp. UYZn731 TaxID=3156345 RepID=UPI003399BB34